MDIEDIRSARREFTAKVDTIRADRRLSPDAKTARIAAATLEQELRMQELRVRYEHDIETAAVTAQRQLFGVTRDLDPAAAISFRDAADRATNPEAAAALIRRAQVTGDRILARGVLSVALEHGWVDALNAYRTTFPEDAGQVTAVVRQREANTETGLTRASENVMFGVTIPSELKGLRRHQLEALAADEKLTSDDPEPVVSIHETAPGSIQWPTSTTGLRYGKPVDAAN